MTSLINHLKGVLSYNYEISDHKDNFEKVAKGLAEIDKLADTQLHTKLQTVQTRLLDNVRPLYPIAAFDEKIATAHDSLLLAQAPLSMVALAKSTVSAAQASYNSNDTLVKITNLFKSTYNAAIFSIVTSSMLKSVTPLISPYHNSPMVNRVLGVSGKFFSNVYKFLNIAGIFTSSCEILQTYKIMDNLKDTSTTVEDSLVKSCFGVKRSEKNKEGKTLDNLRRRNFTLIDRQVRDFRINKMVQTACNIVTFAATVIFTASPYSIIAVMAAVIIKVGSTFYWSHRVTVFMKDANFKIEDDSKISKVARLVTLAATPFLLVGSTFYLASATIGVSTIVDCFAQNG